MAKIILHLKYCLLNLPDNRKIEYSIYAGNHQLQLYRSAFVLKTVCQQQRHLPKWIYTAAISLRNILHAATDSSEVQKSGRVIRNLRNHYNECNDQNQQACGLQWLEQFPGSIPSMCGGATLRFPQSIQYSKAIL